MTIKERFESFPMINCREIYNAYGPLGRSVEVSGVMIFTLPKETDKEFKYLSYLSRVQYFYYKEKEGKKKIEECVTNIKDLEDAFIICEKYLMKHESQINFSLLKERNKEEYKKIINFIDNFYDKKLEIMSMEEIKEYLRKE